MSDEDEIGEKSDMTRIEDLSEFLHQDDPDVDAALKSDDEPPSTEDLPTLDDLEDDEISFLDDNDDSDSDSDSFDSEDKTEPDYTFSNTDDEEDENEETEEFSASFGDEDDFSLGNDEEDSDDDTDFSSEEELDDNSFGSSDDFNSNPNFLNDDDNNEKDENEEIDFSDSENIEEDEDLDEDEDKDNLFSNTEDEEEELENQFSNFSEDNDEKDEPFVDNSSFSTPQHIDRSEKFEDVKSFAKNITYGKISSGGNPPFSIILRNIKFEEDVEDIMIILNEHELMTPETENTMKQSLQGGSLLISQISEYAAIYLTHKFRRFNLDIQMGLSDELHPSKSYESDSVGLISKSRINQNKNETTRIDKSKIELEGIIVSTTPTLENYKIIEYLGIISDFVIVDEEELTNDQELSEYHERVAKGHVDQEEKDLVEDIANDFKVSQSAIYSDLSQKLKPICLKMNANAIVGINYQITPLSDGSKYKISCSGSAVWIIDNN